MTYPGVHGRPGGQTRQPRPSNPLPVILIVVLAVSLLGILAYGLFLRPLMEGGSSSDDAAPPPPRQSVAPGVRFDWGAVPPPNLAALPDLLPSDAAPPTLAGLPLRPSGNWVPPGHSATYRAEEGDGLIYVHFMGWSMYPYYLERAEGPRVIGQTTCYVHHDEPTCMLVVRLGVFQFVGRAGSPQDDLAAAADEFAASMTGKPSDAVWAGTKPPDLASARSLAVAELPDSIGEWEASGPSAFDDEVLRRRYATAAGDAAITISSDQSGYLERLGDTNLTAPFVDVGEVVCGEDTGGIVCMGLGHAELMGVRFMRSEGVSLQQAGEVAGRLFAQL